MMVIVIMIIVIVIVIMVTMDVIVAMMGAIACRYRSLMVAA